MYAEEGCGHLWNRFELIEMVVAHYHRKIPILSLPEELISKTITSS
jgi:hypothetical protein